VSPVLTATEIATDKGFASRDAFTTAHAVTGETWSQLAPMLAGAVRETDYDMPDRSVSDTDDVLLGCGFTSADIAQLRDEGAIA
jgi:crotonobetainyl-CoA:carnitine CoA-transferase CaiB-like acyl-CoA transferase